MKAEWRGEKGLLRGVGVTLLFLLGGLSCASSGDNGSVTGSQSTDAGPSSDAGPSTDASGTTTGPGGSVCAASASADLCGALPSGTVQACSRDASGTPSQTGYLEILETDGSRLYVCATSWVDKPSGGFWFGYPDQFMSDPQSCCGGTATPVAAPTAGRPPIGDLGFPHAPREIKPQETESPGAGMIRPNPFAVIVRDTGGAAAFAAARTTWLGWAGDGNPHPAPDGTGAYYFPASVLINYVIVDSGDGVPLLVIGPEVSLTADGATPLGHPTLGGCARGGGVPLALIAGELSGTTLTNHSGRFGYGPSITQAGLDHAADLFRCLGVSVTGTVYHPPKP
jgi:hypothetical protein